MRLWLSGLAPRRRVLVVGLLATVVIAALGGVTAIVASRIASPGRATAVGLPAPDLLAARAPGPVVLVPGYGGGRSSLLRLAARIRATGRAATVIDLPGDGTGDLAIQAKTLQNAVAAQLRTGASSVDVIGYSAGGVVVRLWLADFGGATEARHVISLGSPLHGAEIAAVGAALVPGACPVACQQLAPGSSVLTRLDALTLPTSVTWMSIWTANDQTVQPPDSARLAGAVNVAAQSVCPDAVISHGGLPTDPLVTGLVLGALGPGPITAPKTADCSALRTLGAAG